MTATPTAGWPNSPSRRDGQTRVTGAPETAYRTHRGLGGYEDIPEDEHVSAEQARTLRHGYCACVSYADARVGMLLDALHRLGLDQNTIVVLWGDHGWSLGEKDRWCKGTYFERDTRGPLMIRTPRQANPGASTEALIEYVDIYPTLASLAGLTPPADLDGRSFVPVLQDPAARGRDGQGGQGRQGPHDVAGRGGRRAAETATTMEPSVHTSPAAWPVMRRSRLGGKTGFSAAAGKKPA